MKVLLLMVDQGHPLVLLSPYILLELLFWGIVSIRVTFTIAIISTSVASNTIMESVKF
jgi:hypothetical protein